MKYGSHIKVWRGCYYHHGIYVGTGQVIHYKSHGIIMTSLDKFSQGAAVEVVSLRPELQPYSQQSISASWRESVQSRF